MTEVLCAQAHKVYVQDRLRESGQVVWRLLETGGHFYVCGDAAHMAGAVEEALLSIIEAEQVLLHCSLFCMCMHLCVTLK